MQFGKYQPYLLYHWLVVENSDGFLANQLAQTELADTSFTHALGYMYVDPINGVMLNIDELVCLDELGQPTERKAIADVGDLRMMAPYVLLDRHFAFYALTADEIDHWQLPEAPYWIGMYPPLGNNHILSESIYNHLRNPRFPHQLRCLLVEKTKETEEVWGSFLGYFKDEPEVLVLQLLNRTQQEFGVNPGDCLLLQKFYLEEELLLIWDGRFIEQSQLNDPEDNLS